MKELAVSLEGVSFAYNSRPVLEDVNLTVKRGEFLAVVGPNGGGKTTLIKLILGLLRPAAGTVRVFGRAPEAARAMIGYVPQHLGTSKGFPLTVMDLVLMGDVGAASFGWRSGRHIRERARQALERVEMAAHAERPVSELSGGQMKRAVVARALVSEPELLLLDEPTASIDPQGKFCFYEFLARLKGGITILVVSHDLSVTAAGLTGMAAVNGRLVQNTTPVLTPEMLRMVYGNHEHTCPMDEYMRGMSVVLPGQFGEDRKQ